MSKHNFSKGCDRILRVTVLCEVVKTGEWAPKNKTLRLPGTCSTEKLHNDAGTTLVEAVLAWPEPTFDGSQAATCTSATFQILHAAWPVFRMYFEVTCVKLSVCLGVCPGATPAEVQSTSRQRGAGSKCFCFLYCNTAFMHAAGDPFGSKEGR